MRITEALDGWQERRLSQAEAARLLSVHERTFWRYIEPAGFSLARERPLPAKRNLIRAGRVALSVT